MNIKKIHIWEAGGFWVIDFYQDNIDGDEALKVCSRTKPEILFQPRYKDKIRLNVPEKKVDNNE